MSTDLILSALAFFVLVSVLTPLSRRIGFVDQPDARKKHFGAIPLIGGVVIYFVLAVSVLKGSYPKNIELLVLCAGFILVTGLVDDRVGLPVSLRFALQSVATALMLLMTDLVIPLPKFLAQYAQVLQPNTFEVVITFFFVLALTNGFNLVDGIDGLSSGLALVCVAAVISFQLIGGFDDLVPWAVLFGMTLIAFFMVNMSYTPLQKIFLGDSGALVVGFVTAWVLVDLSQPENGGVRLVDLLWLVALVLYDVGGVIVSRLLNNRGVFSAGRDHMHYALLNVLGNQVLALTALLVFGSVLASIGVIISPWLAPATSLSLFILGFIVYMYFLWSWQGNDSR